MPQKCSFLTSLRQLANEQFSPRLLKLFGIIASYFIRTFDDLAIAVVPASIQSTVRYRIFHGTRIFMDVRAIWITAMAGERSNVTKKTGQFAGDDVPELKLSHAGGVDDGASEGKRKNFSGRGGVLSLFVLLANRLDSLI